MARSFSVARSFLIPALLVGGAVWSSGAIADEDRAWKSEDGKFTLRAEFVASTGEIVRLKRSDNGKVVDVPISKLSKEDLQYIESRTTVPESAIVMDSAKDPAPTKSTSSVLESNPSTQGMPGPADVGLQMIDDSHYRLIPFGNIGVPKETMFWKISARTPVVFVAQGEPADGVVVLTVLPKCANQDQRVASVKSIYNGLVSQLQAGEFGQLRGEKPDLKNQVADQVDFGISALAPDGSEMHFLTHTRFSHSFSFVFQATSGSLEDSQLLLKVAETFIVDKPKIVEPLPESVVDELTQATESLIAKLESGDTDAALKDLIPPDLFDSLHSDPSQWKEIVDGFEKIDGPALVSKLKGLEVSTGQWDSEQQTVQFLIGPRPLTFQKIDGVWRLQN